MKASAVYDAEGNILSFAVSQPDAPPMTPEPIPGQRTAEVDLDIDPAHLQDEDALTNALKGVRIENGKVTRGEV
jgi:hypothetical protein